MQDKIVARKLKCKGGGVEKGGIKEPKREGGCLGYLHSS